MEHTGDEPLEVGEVGAQPAAQCVITDAERERRVQTEQDRDRFTGWYGENGAERHMRA